MLDICYRSMCWVMADSRWTIWWWYRFGRTISAPMHGIQWLWWWLHWICYGINCQYRHPSINYIPLLAWYWIRRYMWIQGCKGSNNKHRLIWLIWWPNKGSPVFIWPDSGRDIFSRVELLLIRSVRMQPCRYSRPCSTGCRMDIKCMDNKKPMEWQLGWRWIYLSFHVKW